MSSFTSMMQLDAHDKLIRGCVHLQRNQPFFAYILMHFQMRESRDDDGVSTMGVNDYGDLFWNEKFVNFLDNNGLLFVLCHEVMHIAKGDPFRRGRRDRAIWNVASDCIINFILIEEGFTPPKWVPGETLPPEVKVGDTMGLCPGSNGIITIAGKQYSVKNKTTEEFYDDLIEDVETIKIAISMSGDGDGKDGKGTSSHGGFDIHIEGDKDDKGNSQEKSESKKAGQNKQEAHWRKITVEAAVTAKQRGTLPGFADGLVSELLEPKVDWKSRIQSFITNEIPVDFENRLPGRRFYGTQIWCPRVKRENVNIMVSIDCSGSTMGDREKFVSEIQGIVTAHPSVIARLICWDTRVNPDNDIEITTQTVEILSKLKLSNINGGTNISAYDDYVMKKGYTSRIHIHLTDGYIEPNPTFPPGQHLFVLCGHHTDDILKNHGECICIKNDDNYD